jgi:hypothetical protein
MKEILIFFIITGVASCTLKKPDRLKLGAKSEANYSHPVGSNNGNPAGPEIVKPIELDLVTTRSSVRLVSFQALLSKFKYVTGLDDASPAVVQAKKISHSLGDYDFGQGVQPESKWSSDKMSNWFNVVDQACQAPSLLTKIQGTNGGKIFIEMAYGRDINVAEIEMISSLSANKDISADRKARMVCTIVLQSAEFLSL